MSDDIRFMLRTLTDEELENHELASPEEMAHAFRLGELEARLAFPSPGENLESLRLERETLLRTQPMRRG